MLFRYKLLISIFFFIVSALGVHAGAETDQYCLNGSLGYSGSYNPLFSVRYNGGKLPVNNVFRISYGQRGVGEGTGMLYYGVDTGSGYEVYQYNCVTSKPKYIGKTLKNEGDSSTEWYAIYNEPYILYGTMYQEGPGATRLTSISVYNAERQKLELTISHFNYTFPFYNWWPEIVYKTKKGKFLITIVGDHSITVRRAKVIEIDPKTGKVTEL